MIGGAKGIGLGIDLGLVNQYNRTGSQSYIEPEVLDSLVGVWSAYGMTNDSPNRSTIKNKLSNKGGDFVISNAAYDKMSSYGGYEFAKFDNTLDWYNTEGNDSVEVVSRNGHSITLKRLTGPNFWYFQNGTFRGLISNVIPFKVNSNKNITVIWDVHGLSISEGKYKSARVQELVLNPNEDNYTNLKTLNEEELAQIDISTNSLYYSLWFDLSTLAVDEEVTIEMLPLFEGAFVTDGIDDLITSTKTVQEMLGGSNEITVVSMAHFIKGESNAPEICRINQIRRDTRSIRNSISKIGKSGIFGYTYKNGVTTINNILGDKNDCTADGNLDGIVAPFSVEGYYYNNNSNPLELCSIAWYWTIIANKVLITDQINQVIAYFNLDRTLKPDILCNTIKQGITNENHAEFGDKLIDFSGNGRDIQLNNIAWKGDSGIGKYEVDFLDSSIWNSSNSTITSSKIDCKNSISHIMLLYYNVGSKEYPDIPSFKVIKTGADIDYSYIDETGSPKSVKIVDGVNVLPASHNTLYSGSGRFCGFGNPGMGNSVTITQIPSHAGALCLDGVNDFGQFVGDLGLKDYTFIADRAYDRIVLEQAPFIASTQTNGQAPFLMEYLNEDTYVYPHSFGTTTKTTNLNIQRQISYQSTYVYNGNSISKGTSVDTGDGLTIGNSGSTGEQYSPLCLWSLMLFPYSMSEFLIERQLKKHKLGTLYPDMVEFRPVIKSNASYDNIVFYYKNEKVENGTYLTVGSSIGMHIRLSSNPVNEIKSVTVNGIPATFKYHDANNNIYQYDFNLTSKSPQNINITIDEYIRYEDIVQPYPVLLRFNDENGNEVSWGGKFRVGSTITRIGNIADPESNLLNGLYSISGLSLNGKAVTSSTSIVEKQMVFKTIATYLLDNNEPKCILSPRLLRIPNSSYKILGHIPDISGHGNHGKINNSAYAGMSGANGYVENFNEWRVSKDNVVITRTDSKATITKIGINSNTLPFFQKDGSVLINNYVLTVNITGIPEGVKGKFIHNNLFTKELIEGKNTITLQNDAGWYGFTFYNENNAIIGDCNITIEQIGEYEGAYCLDGVDDFVTIPTTVGGKQVLMKVNWNSLNHVLYDQRNNAEAPFCIVTASGTIAYNQRNVGGNTYIDGILNNHILVDDLQAITHNIVLNNDYNVANSNSFIGTNYTKSIYAQMALYDFMLFDNISTDDKIKELNKYVGIEGNVWGILTQLSNSTLISNETLIKNE